MTRMFWRLRLGLLRWIPHTPAKRWLYSALIAIMIAFAVTGHVLLAVGAVVLAVALRFLDLRRNSGRRPQLDTRHAYFFEGSDGDGRQ